MVCGWSITSVDYRVEDWVSIIAGKGRRDSPSVFESALGVVRGNKASGGVEGARVSSVAGSRGIVVAVFSFHLDFAFVPYTGCPVLYSMSCRHKKSFQLIWGRAGRGRRGGRIVS